MVHYVIDKNPIHVKANDIRQIEAAINWAKKHNLKIVIVGGRDSWMNTDLLIRENIPVILTTIQTTPRRRHEPIHLPYKVPSLLQKAGVQFCISTDYGYPLDGHVRTLPNEAMRAITWGLTKQEAMRAITLSAAEILGIDDLVGSLEPGKDATFFISETDPMLIETNPVKAYIRGREVDLSDRQKMLWEKYREKYKRMGKLLK
jgi:imidazolonepropionase-like amidohydrolase